MRMCQTVDNKDGEHMCLGRVGGVQGGDTGLTFGPTALAELRPTLFDRDNTVRKLGLGLFSTSALKVPQGLCSG